MRAIALIVDAAAALALFAVVRRFWGPHPAMVAAAIYQLVPVDLHTMCAANLTNVFGQGLLGIALLVGCWSVGRMRDVVWAIAVALVLASGFMSHFSTLSTGVPIVMAVVAALSTRAESRRAALWLAAALAVALALSYAIYYSQFHEVYAKTISRILTSGKPQEARSMVAPRVGEDRALRPCDQVRLLRSAPGRRQPCRNCRPGRAQGQRRLDEGSGGMAHVVAGFSVLGIVSPIEMRASLAAQPVVGALFGLGASVWSRGAAGMIAAVILIGAVVGRGLFDWLLCLGQVAMR